MRSMLAGTFDGRIDATGSTALATVGYCPFRRSLVVEFRASHRRYRYYRVPLRTHLKMWRGDSLGRYFNSNIRARFPYAEV